MSFKRRCLIVLPQALRAVIPAIVGQFISLFKDTSLVAIVGLVDLLGIAGVVIEQPARWLTVTGGVQREVLLFAALSTGSSASACRADQPRDRAAPRRRHALST